MREVPIYSQQEQDQIMWPHAVAVTLETSTRPEVPFEITAPGAFPCSLAPLLPHSTPVTTSTPAFTFSLHASATMKMIAAPAARPPFG